MFFFSLLHGKDATAKASELGQFLLDLLQAFQSLTVSDLSLLLVAIVIPVLVVQFFYLRDLAAEARDLFAKNFDMIHAFKNNLSATGIVVHNDDCRRSLLLGNFAVRMGQQLQWDRSNLSVNSDVPQKYVRPERRSGWEL